MPPFLRPFSLSVMAQSNMLLVTRALRFPKDNIHLVSCTMPKRRKVKTCPKTCWIYRRGKPSNEALSLNVIVIIGNPYLLFHPGNTSILQFYGISLSKAGFATTEPSKDLAARPNTFFLEPWYVTLGAATGGHRPLHMLTEGMEFQRRDG